ncbi:hypothetical protein Patl1_09066 [Pistacia atlantica]|uniref:Uncharacterized protein n=1 Tax=Pistacia atlantica TaxID=434234 RepID=A0ACC1AHU1_9ROSI|nr:hypothetical protein Patl1_09066 [Pistacia atlantica]
MSTSLVPKTQPTISEADDKNNNNNTTGDQEHPENLNSVTTHLFLRPTQTSQTLEKDEVLRRIRHRKRMNKLKTTVQGLVCWPQPVKTTDKVSVYEMKWVDDAFSAP